MESSGLTKMMIERLPVVVTEAEIKKFINSDNLPQPVYIVMKKSSHSVTAILHFRLLLDAMKFRSKKNGKFLSSKTNITVQAAPIITSNLSQPPVHSAGQEKWKKVAGKSDNICDNKTRDDGGKKKKTDIISVKTETILDSPVYESVSDDDSPGYEPISSPVYEATSWDNASDYEPVSDDNSPQYEPISSPVYEATSWGNSPTYEPVSNENSPLYEALPYDPEEDIEKNILSEESEPENTTLSISPQELDTNLSFMKVISDPGEVPYDPAEKIENLMEVDRPETKPILKKIKVRTNLTAPKTPPDCKNLARTPSSPSFSAESDEPAIKEEVEEAVCGPEPSEVVLVNFHFSPEETISQIRVYLVSIRKNQNFYGKEPAILVGGLLRYIKKYHQQPTTETKMILITPCVFSYGAFYSALRENQENQSIFHNYFSHWLDLQSLNNNYSVKEKKLKMVKGVKQSGNKVQKMLKRMLNKEIGNFSSVFLMKTILNISPLVSDLKQEVFRPHKLLNFAQRCRVARKKYLVVALHLGMAELTVGSEGEVTLSLATISFRDNIRGSWFVGINQPANINRKSASKLGFHQKGDIWSYGEASQTCLEEKAALESFLLALQDEMEQGKFSQVILLTSSNDETLPLLLSSLSRHSLLDAANQMVAGVGSVEEAVRSVSPHLRLSSAGEFSEVSQLVLNKRPDLSRPQTVPKVILEVLEQILGGEASYENFFGNLCHPLISPYTNTLLLHSSLPQVKEDFWDIRATEVTVVKAETNKTIRAGVDVDRISVLGKHIFIQSLNQLQFVERKVRLDKKRMVEFIVFNTRSCDVTIGKNEIIGIAQSNELFPFPQSQFKTSVQDILKSPTVSPDIVKSPQLSSDIAPARPAPVPRKRAPLPGDWGSSSGLVSDLVTAHQTVVPQTSASASGLTPASISVYAPPKEIREAKNIPEIFENQPRKPFEPSSASSVSRFYARGKSDLHDPIKSTDKTLISPSSSSSRQSRDPRQIGLRRKFLVKPKPQPVSVINRNPERPEVQKTLPENSARIPPTLPKSPPSLSEPEVKRREVPDTGEVLLIESLDSDISEAEIRMKISLEKLPRADTIRLRSERGSTTAVLHFTRSSEAQHFRHSLNKRFLSDKRNIFFGRLSDLETGGKGENTKKEDNRENTSCDRRKSIEELSEKVVCVSQKKKSRKDNDETGRSGKTEGPIQGAKRSMSSVRKDSLKEISCHRLSVETPKFPFETPEKSSTHKEPRSKNSKKSKSQAEKSKFESEKGGRVKDDRNPGQDRKKRAADIDSVSDRIIEIQRIIDNSKKFKQDFYKRICASKLASGKAPSIAPATNKRKKVKSEKWIEKESIDQDKIVNEEHLKRKLSDDDTARDCKRPMLETSTSVEVINLSEDDNASSAGLPGDETELESSITVEEFKIENTVDQYSDHYFMEDQKSGIKIELEKTSSQGWEMDMEERCPTPPVSVPKRKQNKKVASFSTKITEAVCETGRRGRVAVTQVNLDQVDDILDMVSYVCETCNKSFISLPGLKSHTTKMHKDNYTEQSCLNGISNYIIDTDPLVPQVKSLSENLQRLAVNEDTLTVHFSILLTFPQFSNLIKTFLRFYQKPLNKIQQDLKEFADCLLSKLMESNVYHPDTVQREIQKMHRKKKNASLKQWREMVTATWKSFNKKQTATEEFYLNDAVQILIMFCSHNLE